MKVKVLASGSKGNATIIETDDCKILIDIGLSYRTLKNKLEEVNINVDEIDALFITHEHSDHIKGMQTFIKKHNINIYMSKGTHSAVVYGKGIGETYQHFNILNVDDEIYVKDVFITPFLVSHDAQEPFGYVVLAEGKKVVYLTDTGYVSEANENKIKCADVYILETNHNVELLMCTNRPWHLKQRILGDFGHLCNEDALHMLNRVRGDNTKYVYLAHISEEANNIDILHLTIKEMTHKYSVFSSIKFLVAHQHEISEIIEI
jgi:phosphoribosyl 1,2-cyclic phosphodiesterase